MVSLIILSLDPPMKLIDDIRKQTYKDFEVIIADDPGIVNAMNKALEKAKGDILIRIDDDVELPEYWLEQIVKPFSDPKVCGVTGPTYIRKELRQNRDSIAFVDKYRNNKFFKWLMDGQPLEPAKIFNCGAVSYGSNFPEFMRDINFNPDHLEGTNWAMRTELIRKVGGFDPKFDGVAEWFDDDVVAKVKKLGYKLVYSVSAPVFHNVSKGVHYEDRFAGLGRIKNWLRYHYRHSKFHYKKIIWLAILVGYFLTRKK